MSFICPNCNAENSAGYAWEGLLIRCPFCLREITLLYGNRQRGKNSGYEVTFKDFYRLVVDKRDIKLIGPLLEKLLDCTVVTVDERFVLKQRGGALIPYEVAHFTIQSDPVQQREFYNLAMMIWVGY